MPYCFSSGALKLWRLWGMTPREKCAEKKWKSSDERWVRKARGRWGVFVSWCTDETPDETTLILASITAIITILVHGGSGRKGGWREYDENGSAQKNIVHAWRDVFCPFLFQPYALWAGEGHNLATIYECTALGVSSTFFLYSNACSSDWIGNTGAILLINKILEALPIDNEATYLSIVSGFKVR